MRGPILRILAVGIVSALLMGGTHACGQLPSDEPWEPSFITNAPAEIAAMVQESRSSSGIDSESGIVEFLSEQATDLTSREGTGSAIKIAIALGALSLAPALILMTTCYVRLIVVLTLLRQAFGAQQLPPTQVITALALFMTLLIMTPVWKEIKQEAIDRGALVTEELAVFFDFRNRHFLVELKLDLRLVRGLLRSSDYVCGALQALAGKRKTILLVQLAAIQRSNPFGHCSNVFG